ncbi:MAG: M23 family metallopeptidase [Trueperaceae bacterium]
MPGPRAPATLALVALLALATPASAQTVPDGSNAKPPFVCPGPDEPQEPPRTDAEARERAVRDAYRAVFPIYVLAAGPTPDAELRVPVNGVRVAQIADTWGAPRGPGRLHQGQDLFAPNGTPVRSATDGYVWRIGERILGGLTVTVVGGGGIRYYYAHLSAYADVREGQRVDRFTILGYVGTSGNARSTPPHLHFGAYRGDDDPCSWNAFDPLPYLVDR